MSKIKDQNKSLEGKIKLFNDEIKKLKGNKRLQSQGNRDIILLTVTIVILIIWGVYGILRLLEFFRKQKSERKK